MTKEDYIKFCRFYKGGGRESSDKETNRETAAIIALEHFWVVSSVKGDIGWVLDEYLACGLREFEQFDGTPVTLKAFLFNRFCDERIDVEGFKQWYKEIYMKQSENDS